MNTTTAAPLTEKGARRGVGAETHRLGEDTDSQLAQGPEAVATVAEIHMNATPGSSGSPGPSELTASDLAQILVGNSVGLAAGPHERWDATAAATASLLEWTVRQGLVAQGGVLRDLVFGVACRDLDCYPSAQLLGWLEATLPCETGLCLL